MDEEILFLDQEKVESYGKYRAAMGLLHQVQPLLQKYVEQVRDGKRLVVRVSLEQGEIEQDDKKRTDGNNQQSDAGNGESFDKGKGDGSSSEPDADTRAGSTDDAETNEPIDLGLEEIEDFVDLEDD